jgi:HSP20 family protein
MMETETGERVWRPAADLYATPTRVELVIELPGAARDDVRLSLEDDELFVEATVAALPGEPVGGERVPRRFRRLFRLPWELEREGVRASLRDGLLRVTLPRRLAAEGAARDIPVEEG